MKHKKSFYKSNTLTLLQMKNILILSLLIIGLISCNNNPKSTKSTDNTSIEEIGYRASLYETSWPADMANLNRSNAVNNAGFPVGTSSEDVKIETVEMPFPSFAYTRAENEIFVVGGTPFMLGVFDDIMDGTAAKKKKNSHNKLSKEEMFKKWMIGESKPEPHITKYNPTTGQQKRVDLTLGNTVPYIGGALMHANGYVYIISQSYLYKIEAESMKIVKTKKLPTVPEPNTINTIYNGLTTSSTGELITKYWELQSPASKFMLIDPNTLDITFELEFPGASPRLTVQRSEDGNEYLYHLNKHNTFRFLIKKGSLTLDENWQARYDPYNTGKDKNEEPTSPVIVNDKVFYTTNTSFMSKTPMKIFWQSINQTYNDSTPPLSGPYLFENAENPGWNFFHLSIDDASEIVIGTDQANGLICALQVNENNEVVRLWQKELKVSARPAIVSDRKMVYATDYVEGHNHLVVLDLITGKELIRKKTPATHATISTIVVSRNNEVYFGSNEPGESTGLFHRFYVDSK